jgi:hypothetical protein
MRFYLLIFFNDEMKLKVKVKRWLTWGGEKTKVAKTDDDDGEVRQGNAKVEQSRAEQISGW